MAFTQDYLELCYKYRRIYQNKRRIKGDWYANLATPEIQVYDGKSAAGRLLPLIGKILLMALASSAKLPVIAVAAFF